MFLTTREVVGNTVFSHGGVRVFIYYVPVCCGPAGGGGVVPVLSLTCCVTGPLIQRSCPRANKQVHTCRCVCDMASRAFRGVLLLTVDINSNVGTFKPASWCSGHRFGPQPCSSDIVVRLSALRGGVGGGRVRRPLILRCACLGFVSSRTARQEH